MICAWIETSSAETGSSPTRSLGSTRQRAGDADALALAAGELVRVAVQRSAAEPDQLEQLRDAAARRRRRAEPCRRSGSATISPDASCAD